MNTRASMFLWLLLTAASPAFAQDAPEKFYATGLVTVSVEDANQLVILVPEWDVLLTVMAFKRDPAGELSPENYDEILVDKDEKAEALRALEGKVVAVEGVIGEGGEKDSPHMRVTDFIEAQHDAAKALLTLKK